MCGKEKLRGEGGESLCFEAFFSRLFLLPLPFDGRFLVKASPLELFQEAFFGKLPFKGF